jgi:hypothetical protein
MYTTFLAYSNLLNSKTLTKEFINNSVNEGVRKCITDFETNTTDSKTVITLLFVQILYCGDPSREQKTSGDNLLPIQGH